VKPYIIVNPIAGSIVDLNLRLKQLRPLNAREVRVTQRAGDAEMALLAAEMLLGKHLSSDAVIFWRAKKISGQSQPGMWFNADGELVGNEPAVFQVLPRALDFVINKR
jgi:diacylglycerol kinase family enzyme